jgi:hypothetical protein
MQVGAITRDQRAQRLVDVDHARLIGRDSHTFEYRDNNPERGEPTELPNHSR